MKKCDCCGFENTDETTFCQKCGIPFDLPTQKSDDSEGSTTVLTDDSEANTTVLTDDSEDSTTVLTNANAQTLDVIKVETENKSENETDKKTKQKKEKKEKKEKKVKSVKKPRQPLTGSQIYLIASIAAMVLLVGVGGFFFYRHTSKIADMDVELASLTDAVEAYETKYTKQKTKISEYEDLIDEMTSESEENAATIDSLQEDIKEYSSSSDYYANYNGLIEFADANTGTSDSSMFASDTVLHMTDEEVLVYVYVDEKTDINCVIDNKDIATVEWVGWAEDNVAILQVVPGTVIGSTKITLVKGDGTTTKDDDDSDDSAVEDNAEKINIFVYSD